MAGLYFHVPFCKSKCYYCDFYSRVNIDSLRDAYLCAVERELALRKDFLQDEVVKTVYFGGGTPSLLTCGEIARLTDRATALFNLDTTEVTLEANPENLSDGYLKGLKDSPVNRLSIGIQSFSDAELAAINRKHSAQDAIDAVKRCQDAGFENISIDLIYGLPSQTIEGWNENLQKAVALDVPHISSYHLTYEEGTVLYLQAQKGKIAPVNEELSVEMFRTLRQTLLAAGYDHYEISNFAKPGLEAKHNSSYWDGTKYLGLGPAAHSFDGDTRHWNFADTRGYIDALARGEFPCETEVLTEADRYNEFVMTSLRTAKGISLNSLLTKFGAKMRDFCLKNAAPFLKNGTLEDKNGNLRLTEDGIFISDGIMSELMWVD